MNPVTLKFKLIRQKVVVDASPADVYEALLYPEKHAEFTGSPATGSPRVGGKFTAWDGYISGKILALQKGKRIVEEWKTTEWPPGYPPSILELRFKAKGTKTELSMAHSKVPAEQAESYREGWISSYWDPLKEYFASRGPDDGRR